MERDCDEGQDDSQDCGDDSQDDSQVSGGDSLVTISEIESHIVVDDHRNIVTVNVNEGQEDRTGQEEKVIYMSIISDIVSGPPSLVGADRVATNILYPPANILSPPAPLAYSSLSEIVRDSEGEDAIPGPSTSHSLCGICGGSDAIPVA